MQISLLPPNTVRVNHDQRIFPPSVSPLAALLTVLTEIISETNDLILDVPVFFGRHPFFHGCPIIGADTLPWAHFFQSLYGKNIAFTCPDEWPTFSYQIGTSVQYSTPPTHAAARSTLEELESLGIPYSFLLSRWDCPSSPSRTCVLGSINDNCLYCGEPYDRK